MSGIAESSLLSQYQFNKEVITGASPQSTLEMALKQALVHLTELQTPYIGDNIGPNQSIDYDARRGQRG